MTWLATIGLIFVLSFGLVILPLLIKGYIQPSRFSLFDFRKFSIKQTETNQYMRLILTNGVAIDIDCGSNWSASEIVTTMNEAIKGKRTGELAGTFNAAFFGVLDGQIWVQLEHIAIVLLIEKVRVKA
jgi:hypothetical protein